MKEFLASLHHAVWTRKSVDIAGSYFEAKEIEEPLRMLEAAPDLLEALLNALPYVEDVLNDPQQLACFKPGIVEGHAKSIRAAIAKATGE